MTLWRIHLKPDADGVDPCEFCLEKNILGFGWPVESHLPLDWDAYYKLGEAEYGDKSWRGNLKAIREDMKDDDLCWARDRNGKYYLGRVEGVWKYCGHQEEYRKADIVNVRPCRWFPTGEVDSVPGKVVNAFILGRTLQRVGGKTASFYSRFRYNELCGEEIYSLGRNALDFFELIRSEGCEDIVGIYLQEERGYRIIPSSCKRDTAKTEFILKNRKGERANVQVKQGEKNLNRDDYNDPLCDWFLFTTQGEYIGGEHPRVYCLNPDKMKEFAFKNRALMPDRIQEVIRFIESVS